MRVGKLRHRINIYNFNEIKNEYGEAKLKETLVTTVWGMIDAIKGDEKYINNKEVSNITHNVEIRYLSNLDESYFVKFKDRVFDIKSVINPYEKNERLILLCVERKRGLK